MALGTQRGRLLQWAAIAGLMTGSLLASDWAHATIDEVVVTARKREESALTVPIAITAIPPKMLERQGATDIEDLEGLAPNIVIDPVAAGPQGAAISIRGVSFEDIEKSFDPAVGVVVDGVYIGTNTGQLVDFFDFEVIEVLRGPQGTLFGKNTTGGVINIRRSRPTGEWGFRGSAGMGNRDRRDFKAVANFPILGDALAGKAFYFVQEYGGHYFNKTAGETRGGSETHHVGATFLSKPIDGLMMQATYEYIDDWQENDLGSLSRTPDLQQFLDVPNGQEIINNILAGDIPGALAAGLKNAFEPDLICASPVPIPGLLPPREECDRNTKDDLYTTFNEIAGFIDYEVHIVTAEVTYDISEDYSIASVTGYRNSTERAVQDFDSSSVEFFWTDRPQEYEQFSQELRFAAEPADWAHITVGGYYWYSNYFIDYLLTTPLSPTGPIRTIVDHEVTSWAWFAEGAFDITDKLGVTIGGRFTSETKNIHSILPDSGFTVGGTVIKEDRWTEFTPKASIDYKLDATNFLYGSYARGFRSGGYNGRATTPDSVGPYDPEFVDTYELGYKSLIFGSRLSMNAAVFYSDYADKQEEIVRLVSTISGNPQETVVQNVAAATIWGIEFDAMAELFEGFRVNGAIGYLNASYDEFRKDLDGDGVDDDASSLEMRRTPDFTYSVGATYVRPVWRGELVASVNFRHIDQYETVIIQDPEDHTRNDRRGTAQAQNQLSANMSYQMQVWGERTVKLSIYGRNLLDEKGLAAALPVAGLFAFGGARPPRAYGFDMSMNF